MGFLSGLLGGKKQKVPASGFYAQPKAFQKLYKGILNQAQDVVLPGGQLNSAAFTPMGPTADETTAFQNIRQGFTPTPNSLTADIGMQMNPFDQFVIDEINRQAQGENSILQQNISNAGQMGSNRQMFGAGDIDRNRLQQIGLFKQGQFNTSLQNALNTLPASRRLDTQGMLGIGDFQRQLALQQAQAPFQVMQAGLGLLGGFGQMGQGTPETTVKSGGGFLGNFLKTAAPIALKAWMA